MSYEDLIQTLTELVGNDKIYKENLVLVYQLPEMNHKKMYEHLFYKTNVKSDEPFESKDEFEVEIEGILVRFINSKK